MVDDMDDLSRRADLRVTVTTEDYIHEATNVQCSAQDLRRRAETIAAIQSFSWSGGWCDADRCTHRRFFKEGHFLDHCDVCLHRIEWQGADMNQSLRIEVVCPSCHRQHFDVQPSELNELVCEGCNISITETMITIREAQEEENNVG